MENTQNLSERRLADAWAELQTQANNGTTLQADAYRLAFADPEFLLRRESRGLRLQLEMLKPDLAQQALGIENTIVVFGSARFRETSEAQALLAQATRRPWRAPKPCCAMRRITTKPANLPAPWRATAPAANRPACPKTGCLFAPAAARASWKRPTGARTTRAR